MQKQIRPPTSTKQIAGNMNASVGSQKARIKIHKKVFEMIKE